MGFGLNLDAGSILRNVPGIGSLFGGPDDPYGDWLLQQKYNSPVEQMKRLEEAGLNPNLIYANGVSNTATSAIRSRDGGLGLSVGFNEAPPNADIQRELLNKQLDMVESREDSIRLDNRSKELRNELLQKTLDFYKDTGFSPADNPYVKLFGRLYSGVIDYDKQTGNLSKGAEMFFTFLNNLFGIGSVPQETYPPVVIRQGGGGR